MFVGPFAPEDVDPTGRALCVDPVALAGGNALADSIVPVNGPLVGGGDLSAAGDFDTRYIVLPEILTASCETRGEYAFFSVGLASETDARTTAVEGLLNERLGDTWGLHLQDAQLAMGDLLEVTARQVEAFTSSCRRGSGLSSLIAALRSCLVAWPLVTTGYGWSSSRASTPTSTTSR